MAKIVLDSAEYAEIGQHLAWETGLVWTPKDIDTVVLSDTYLAGRIVQWGYDDTEVCEELGHRVAEVFGLGKFEFQDDDFKAEVTAEGIKRGMSVYKDEAELADEAEASRLAFRQKAEALTAITGVDYSDYDPEDDDPDQDGYLMEMMARAFRPDLYPAPDEDYHRWSHRKYPESNKAERKAIEKAMKRVGEVTREWYIEHGAY